MMIPALWQEADFTAQMLHLEHGADHLAVIPLEGRVEMHHFRQLVTSPPTQAHPQGLYWQSCSTHTRHFARIHTPDRYSNKRAREAVRICSLRVAPRWKDTHSNKRAREAVRICSLVSVQGCPWVSRRIRTRNLGGTSRACHPPSYM